MSKKAYFIIKIYIIIFLLALPNGAMMALPEGSLIRSMNDFKVYYIEEGKKRWVDSADTFRIHGFSWDEVNVISASDASLYKEGEILTPEVNIILPGEMDVLPDLVPFPVNDLRLTDKNGRTILKFSSTMWNKGKGPIELIGNPEDIHIAGDLNRNVYQRIVRTDGSERHKLVGEFLWHSVPGHLHYHFKNFSEYIFQSAQGITTPAIQEKATRCLWDTVAVDLSIEGAPQNKGYTSCDDKRRQGVSAGWGDVYKYTLADQYLDVEDLPPGIYRLEFHIDPLNLFAERSRDNNTSVAIVKLDVRNGIVEAIAAGGPFSFSPNFFPNKMLIQAEGEDKIYAIHNNKKRLVQSGNDVYVFPKNVIDVIPFNNLIRKEGAPEVYALNDKGYKRHILNIEVFNSYGFSWDDIAEVSVEEFEQHPTSRLVRLAGDINLYAIDGKTRRLIDPVETALGPYSWDEFHVINEVDFKNYGL